MIPSGLDNIHIITQTLLVENIKRDRALDRAFPAKSEVVHFSQRQIYMGYLTTGKQTPIEETGFSVSRWRFSPQML